MRIILSFVFILFLSACDNNTPLMRATADGNVEQVQIMLTNGADVDETNRYGWTALMHAAKDGNIEVAKLLLEEGADIEAEDRTNWTPMLRAAQKGHTEIVKFLVSKGANVNAVTDEGWTALMWASLREKLGVVKFLVRVEGININHLSTDGRSAILIAITENNNDILIVLQDAGARP